MTSNGNPGGSPIHYSMPINGQSVAGETYFEVVDPATHAVAAYVPDATAGQLDLAIGAARRAFEDWRTTSISQRQEALRSAAAAITAHADELAAILTCEQGKPLRSARTEVLTGAYWFESMASMDLPVIVNEDSAVRRSETRRVPVGVVAAIVPWNFPIMMACWKMAPALLAGNAIVVKPSPYTPLATLRLGHLLQEVLPAGLINIVSGSDALGPMLSDHAGVDKITFTGSTQTGRRVMASAAATLKQVTLELGGNDPAIVLPDVDVDAVAGKLFWAAFANTGQVCVATKRLYVHDDIYDELLEKLVKYAATVKIGNGAEAGVLLGPLQNRLQYDKVKALLSDSRLQGHKFAVGGEEGADEPGYFVPISIIDNPPHDSRIVKEEQFGPILPVIRFTDIDDAISLANDSEYGLAASVWSNDAALAARVAERLDAGTVWINEVQYLSPFAPFGGHKQSGIGSENGVEGLMEYTRPKTVTYLKPKNTHETGKK